MLLDSCKKYIQKKITEWFNLPIIVKIDCPEGKIQKLEVKKNNILLVESFLHYHPQIEVKKLSKYYITIFYISAVRRLKQINQVKDLENIKKEFNQKINKLIIEKI